MTQNRATKIRQVTYMATRLSHRDFDACSRAVRELYANSSLEAFPDRLLPLLAKLVPSGHLSYNELDPQRNRFVSLLYPARPETRKLLPQFAAHYHSHPLRDHYQKRDGSPKKISDVATLRQFQRTAIFQEYYRPADTRHQIVCFFDHKKGAHLGVAFNRWERDFSERDRSVLEFLSPHITQAYRNAHTASAMGPRLESIGEGLDLMGRAVILADLNRRIQWQSPLAREWLREFFPDERSMERLPLSLAKRLEQIGKSSRAHGPVFSELQTPQQGDCRLLIYCSKSSSGEYVLALARERQTMDPVAVQQYELTPREAEILFWISEAKTRPEIGIILGTSWRTIAKHMERLFAKLGVENRLEAQRLARHLRRV